MTAPSAEPPPEGGMQPSGPASVGVPVIIGLVGGWLFHPVSDRFGTPPLVSWLQPASLAALALVLAVTARQTHRALQVRRERLEPHRAVNRLLLARACILVGGLVTGGYFGYAVSWLGLRAELADERILRSSLAGVAGVAIVISALLLERACRVSSGGEET